MKRFVTICLALVAWPGTAAFAESTVSFRPAGDRIEVLLDGRPFTSFHYGPQWDKPFLHPLRTVTGLIVSRGFPLEPRPGESTDHPWHRGLWWGHGDVNGEDFWRELGREKTGRLVRREGPTAEGRLSAVFEFVTPRGVRLGSVRQGFAFSKVTGGVAVDADIEIRADRGQPLRLGDTEDGGFGIRLRDEFRQDRGATLVNSEGLRGTENIWGKSARWVDYSAVIEGRSVGVLVMDHPGNLRHPAHWHARGYGLCSANPFGLASFTGDAARDGAYVIPPGQSLILRYRVLIHEGDFARSDLERWYEEYASRTVTVIHTTDLYEPPVDPDDWFDLATLFALPELDVRAVIFDVERKFLEGEPRRQPGLDALERLAAVFDRKAPPAAAGPPDRLSDRIGRDQPGVALLIRALEESPAPAYVTVLGSARVVAAALRLEPELMKRKVRAVLLNAGSAEEFEELEWNVALDPGAYAEVLNSGLPVDWYPCAAKGPPRDGPFARGARNTFWKARQSALLADIPGPLAGWFLSAFPGKSREQVLEMERNMWSTASLILAAGRALARTEAGWRFVSTRRLAPEAETELLALEPVTVQARPDGRTRWRPASRSPVRLFRRNPTPRHEAAMTEALNALLAGR